MVLDSQTWSRIPNTGAPQRRYGHLMVANGSMLVTIVINVNKINCMSMEETLRMNWTPICIRGTL